MPIYTPQPNQWISSIHLCRSFLACITWTKDSISHIVRPTHNALHLPQQKLLHEDENRGHFIRKPGKRIFVVLCYVVEKHWLLVVLEKLIFILNSQRLFSLINTFNSIPQVMIRKYKKCAGAKVSKPAVPLMAI